MPDMSKIPHENLGDALEAAVREAVDDNTFRKVKRCSYAQTPQDVRTINRGFLLKNGRSNLFIIFSADFESDIRKR